MENNNKNRNTYKMWLKVESLKMMNKNRMQLIVKTQSKTQQMDKKHLCFMRIKLVELDKLAMVFGSMVSTRTCKSFHVATTMEGSQCKVIKQHYC
jgi:ornithine carbamoyltransferase